MNPHRLSSHLNRRSLRTRFAIRFLHSLKRLSTRKGVRRRCQMIKLTADASMASVVGPQRAWSRASLLKIRRRRATRRTTEIKSVLRRKKTTAMKMKKKKSGGGGGTQEEKLMELVPGGKVMETSILLDETAHYIKCLTQQVMAMRHIVDYCSIN